MFVSAVWLRQTKPVDLNGSDRGGGFVALLTLFFSALIAATLFPFYSEAILVALVRQAEYPALLLLVVATLGNTLGSLINWVLGRYLLHYQDRKWFYIKTEQLHKWQSWFNKYGNWSLLFAWLPVIGDPLTFVAGVMRVHWLRFLLLVAAGKAARYAVLIYLGEWSLSWYS